MNITASYLDRKDTPYNRLYRSSWVESRRSLGVKADDPEKEESRRSGLKADDPWVKADDPGRKQTVLCQSGRSFWDKADDLSVKADDLENPNSYIKSLTQSL